MDSCQSNELVTNSSQFEYQIGVKTGDRKGAGTDANVTVVLHNDDGQSTGQLHLDKFLKNDFEKGNKDCFKAIASFMSVIDFIEVWRDDAGLKDEWFLESMEVYCKFSNKTYVFPFLRWIKEGYHYKIRHLDTSLPQYDPQKEQRLMELNDKKSTYQMTVKIPGLPIQAKEVPEDEKFSSDYQVKFDLVKLAAEITIKGKIVKVVSGDWDNLDDLGNIYKSDVFYKPSPLADGTWDTDEHFGFQRIGRINNSLITLCTEIPNKLAVTEEMLKPFLECSTLPDVISKKKLFYVDLAIVEGIPVKSGLTVCAPIALFYHNKKSRLVPIAIQLKQQPADENPVFLPSDPKYTWLAAKMWFNLADASYHESNTHLGFTHLLMEGCALSTHRNLSQSHPIFKLLAPHFLYLIAINGLALTTLINSDGWVQNAMAIGIDGVFELIKRKLDTWRMDVDGTLPKELKTRWVLDQAVLKGYHYREDALPLYNIIKNYVTKYVKLYYDSPATYSGDHEIQAWAQELVKPRSEGGCGLLGVPGEGNIANEEDLVCILTCVIFTGSVIHAASNFAQYDEYGFPPNYPMTMKGKPPTDKSALTESCILEALPNKAATFEIITITKLLSTNDTNKLGDYEMKYIYDPKAEQVLQQFQKELAEQSKRVQALEKKREFSFKWLDPDIVPNAISI